jgi:D-amino-acid oxidase
MAPRRVVVVGGGVSGLTCAVALLRAGAAVVVRTAAAPMGTTSAVAGAMCGPVVGASEDPSVRWGQVSDRVFRELAKDPTTGVAVRRGRLLISPVFGELIPSWAGAVPGYRRCTSAELPAGFAAGFWAELPFADMPRYLGSLVDSVHGLGGRIEQRPVRTLDDAVDEAEAIVNCTGLAANLVVPDDSVMPVRGQHVIVHAPTLREFVYEGGAEDAWVGVFPHDRRVVLGGVAQPGNTDLAPDPVVTREILSRCITVVPELAAAPVIGVEVGIRPLRPTVRVEAEDRGEVRIVHNYGHGGVGVMLSWGCAEDVVQLTLG